MRKLRELLGAARPFVVAEIGVNHNGRLDKALALVEMSARAGVQAVKFQAFRAERLVRGDAPLAAYQRRNLGGDPGGQMAMLRALEIDLASLEVCARRSRELGLAFGVTPFDESTLADVLRLEPDFLKIGSGDADNLPLLAAARESGFPVVVSTGMSTLAETARLVRWFAGAEDRLALLHCVSSYPAPEDECNLAVIPRLEALGCPAGFSDHTVGRRAAVLAVALGAVILERHVTLDRAAPGPDHACSSDEQDLRGWLADVRAAVLLLGDGDKRPMPCEADVRRAARKSLVLTRALAEGERLAGGDIACLRPADGLPPWRITELVGGRAARELPAGTVLAATDVRPQP